MTVTNQQPLAARMRPKTLAELVGQDHLIYPGSPLHQLVSGTIGAPSVLLWAPPATGKTSTARIIAETTAKHFRELSATSAGVKDVRAAVTHAQAALTAEPPVGTVLFIDEIHRFSKAQQDILLPAVESGTVSLIGATTENPSFSVNPALRSRAILLRLEPLSRESIVAILANAVTSTLGLDAAVELPRDVALSIADVASGDARQALTVLELAAGVSLAHGRRQILAADVENIAPAALLRYDRDGDQHYDIVSAFVKAMRGSDPDAALHWLARLIASGEDPRFIARRILIHASEDVGMADPTAILVAHAASYAVATVGLPEARINLAQAVIHICTARKSNSVVAAIDAAMADVDAGRTGSVPVHLRDPHYPGAKALGHGRGYIYPHDHPHGVGPVQQYGPDGIELNYYTPTDHGSEAVAAHAMSVVKTLRAGASAPAPSPGEDIS
ncbi:putative ATPase [Rhodococcus sp. OAS809]|uniref:replication-associated recombination protein A n=1 Tax=Rhodococcus sp. OAS809 TaxID=2663874 RepID=UPI001A0B91D3